MHERNNTVCRFANISMAYKKTVYGVSRVPEVEGARHSGRPKKTWTEIVEKDCQVHGLNREDAMDCIRWKKQIRDD